MCSIISLGKQRFSEFVPVRPSSVLVDLTVLAMIVGFEVCVIMCLGLTEGRSESPLHTFCVLKHSLAIWIVLKKNCCRIVSSQNKHTGSNADNTDVKSAGGSWI